MRQDFEPITPRDYRDMRRLAIDILALGKQLFTEAEFKKEKRCQNARYILAVLDLRKNQHEKEK